MPMYDVECLNGHQTEVLAQIGDLSVRCKECGELTVRIWLPRKRAVIGDEMDYIDHNLGPEPVHITSRAQRKRLMAKAGLIEKIRHVDGDKHVKKWV